MLVLALLPLVLASPGRAAEWRTTYDFGAGAGSEGWSTAQTREGLYSLSLRGPEAPAPSQWIWPTGSATGALDYTNDPGTSARWLYEAPGDARVLDARFEEIAHRDHRDKQYLQLDLDTDRQYGGWLDVYVYSSIVDLAGGEVPLSARVQGGAKVAEQWLATAPCGAPSRWGCPPRLRPPFADGEYAFNRIGRVRLTLSDPEPPAVATQGPLRQLAERGWTSATGAYNLVVAARDASSGVSTVRAEVDARSLLDRAAPCDERHLTAGYGGRACPEVDTATAVVDVARLSDGAHRVVGTAVDDAAQRGEDAFVLQVDHSPPGAPERVRVAGGRRRATLSWSAAPPGPGAPLAGYEFRTRVNGGLPSRWRFTPALSTGLEGLAAGATVDAEVRALDAAGNRSATRRGQGRARGYDRSFFYEPSFVEGRQGEPIRALRPRLRGVGATAFRSSTPLPEGLRLDPRTGLISGTPASPQPPTGYRIVAEGQSRTASTVVAIATGAREALRAAKALFQPVLYVGENDNFWPVAFPNAMALTWDKRYTCLNRGSAKVACGATREPLSLSFLAPRTGDPDRDFLDYPAGRGDIDDQANSMKQQLRVSRENPNPYPSAREYFYPGYGRRPDTVLSFQFWYFYGFNYVPRVPGLARGYHEGDWEQASILFRRAPRRGSRQRYAPAYVFFSQHTGGQRLRFGDRRVERESGRPRVHAAQGTHANYPGCGVKFRVGPPDYAPCPGSDAYRFSSRTRLQLLRNDGWACWNGRVGRGGSLPRYGAAPTPPLTQQKTFTGGPANLCVARPPGDTGRAAGSGPAPAAEPAAADLDAPVEQEDVPADGGSDTSALFDDCADWHQPPDTPGHALLLACDQDILSRYFASGLTDVGRERLRIQAPGQEASAEPPAVYEADDLGELDAACLRADAPARPDVLVAVRRADGSLEQAEFGTVVVPGGECVRLVRSGSRWQLIGAGGAPLATTTSTLVVPSAPLPTGLSATQPLPGAPVTVAWTARPAAGRDVSYTVLGAPTRAGLLRAPSVSLPVAGRSGSRFRARLPRTPGVKWVTVLAIAPDGTRISRPQRVRRTGVGFTGGAGP